MPRGVAQGDDLRVTGRVAFGLAHVPASADDLAAGIEHDRPDGHVAADEALGGRGQGPTQPHPIPLGRPGHGCRRTRRERRRGGPVGVVLTR